MIPQVTKWPQNSSQELKSDFKRKYEGLLNDEFNISPKKLPIFYYACNWHFIASLNLPKFSLQSWVLLKLCQQW